MLESELVRWMNSKSGHLPLLIRGARQVGKSYLIEAFGSSHFKDIITVDFERRPELKTAFASREPKEILTKLEFFFQKAIKPGSSLLFLDEIQLCPEALISLRYFKEIMPDLHVIAAGSLLEFFLEEENFSFPVGRVEFLYLRPLSFIEYMQAAAPFIAQKIPDFTLSNLPNEFEHRELLKWVRRYLFIGGMPSAIEASLIEDSLLESQRVHYRIVQAYESDFAKYAKHTQHKYLQAVFHTAPGLIAQILKYKHIDPESRSRELKPAIDLLCKSGLLGRVYATSAAGLPLHAHIKEDRFKLLYLDVGLLQSVCKVDANVFFEQDIIQINKGMIAEQFVGQELISYSAPYQNSPMLFWERQGGIAEIDYLTNVGSEIIPIEVKAGARGSLRSLRSFLQDNKSKIGVRISEHTLSFHDRVLSVPFYLIGNLENLVKEAISQAPS